MTDKLEQKTRNSKNIERTLNKIKKQNQRTCINIEKYIELKKQHQINKKEQKKLQYKYNGLQEKIKNVSYYLELENTFPTQNHEKVLSKLTKKKNKLEKKICIYKEELKSCNTRTEYSRKGLLIKGQKKNIKKWTRELISQNTPLPKALVNNIIMQYVSPGIV